MIIWRGWGILSALLALIGLGAGAGIGTSIDDGPIIGVTMGGGLTLAGIGGYFLGHWLNQIRPAAEIERARAQLHQDMWGRIQRGEFQLAPGVPAPRSQPEAEQQVAEAMAHYEPQLNKLRNRHSLFWIPMQWASLGLGAIGVAVLIAGLVGLLTA